MQKNVSNITVSIEGGSPHSNVSITKSHKNQPIIVIEPLIKRKD